jgi:hypothetical protein
MVFSYGRTHYCNVFFACVVEYIIAIAKEINIVEKMIKLSSFYGCYQNWMTYVQFSFTFSTKIVVVVITVTSTTTTSTHSSYSRTCD